MFKKIFILFAFLSTGIAGYWIGSDFSFSCGKKARNTYKQDFSEIALKPYATTFPKLKKKTEPYVKPTIYELSNGLQVVIIENPRSPVVEHQVWYKVGSIDESPGKSGLAHFLEHLMFRGESARFKADTYDIHINRMGSEQNATTGSDRTMYYVRAPKEHLEKIMDLESSRMEKLKLTDEVVLPERKVILEEYNMRIGNVPQNVITLAMDNTLYEQHPYQRPTIGWKEEIEGLNTEDALDFHRRFYAPNNAILIINGDVKVEEVKKLVDKYFAPIKRRETVSRIYWPEPTERDIQHKVYHADSRVKKPVYCRSYKIDSGGYGDKNSLFISNILNYILSVPEIGLLDRQFIKKEKLVTQVGSYANTLCVGPGSMIFYLIPKHDKDLELLDTKLSDYLAELADSGIPKDLIKTTIERLVNQSEYENDDVFSLSDAIGEALVRGFPIEVAQNYKDYLQQITPEQVNAFAKTLFSKKSFVSGYLKPLSGTQQENDSNEKVILPGENTIH